MGKPSISCNSEAMGGTAVFAGTRVPVQTLLDYLGDGFSLEQFLEMFPSVARDDAVEFLHLARGTNDESHPGREPAQAT